MATKRKKSTQTYTHVELYKGPDVPAGYAGVGHRDQDESTIRIALLKGQYSSTFVINRLIKRVSPNGIPWSQWNLWGQVTISTKARGNGTPKLNIYTKYRTNKGNAKKWMAFSNATSRPESLQQVVRGKFFDDFNREVERLIKTNIGEPLVNIDDYLTTNTHVNTVNPEFYVLHNAYPLTQVMKSNTFANDIPSGLTGAFRLDNPKDFVTTIFGKKNYRKDLMKAALKSDMVSLSNASILKGIIPIDWIIDYLNACANTPRRNSMHERVFILAQKKAFKQIFMSCTEAQRKRLYKEYVDSVNPSNPRVRRNNNVGWLVQDTLNMFSRLHDEGNRWAPGQLPGKNWKEIHDNFDMLIRQQRTADKPIERNNTIAKKIDAISWENDFELVMPATTHTMLKWGQEMNHCIGSYTEYARNQTDVFVGIVKDSKMIGNAQINVNRKEVVQVFGKHNVHLDRVILDEFTRVLIENKVVPQTAFKHTAGYKTQVYR